MIAKQPKKGIAQYFLPNLKDKLETIFENIILCGKLTDIYS